MLKSDNYINVQAFMVTDLGLTGNDLLVYAIIHGFSHDGSSAFCGTRAYLAEWCGCTIRGIQKNLNNLMARGLIVQVSHSPNNQQVIYKVTDWQASEQSSLTSEQSSPASEQSSPVLVNKVHQSSEQSSPVYKDNLKDNIKDNLKDSIVVCDTKTKRFQKPTFEEVESFATRNGAAVVDPQRFIDYYTANGWKVGKNQMKDWQAAFRMWESREKKSGTGSGSKKAETIPYMQNEYTEDHLKQKEEESLKLLDDLLGGE